jgi:hypothetical protein
MLRRLAATLVAALALPGAALAGGGDYVFEGATPAERSTVRAALEASAFDWGVVGRQVTVHVGDHAASHSTPGHVYLDRGLLAAGRFAWPVVMDEFAHQVDFFALDPERRALLQQQLGGGAWCYERAGIAHAENACERFSSMVAWAYWPTRASSYRPESAADETAAMPAAEFRLLLSALLGVPSSLKKRGR